MSKPVLSVPGIDPARIECVERYGVAATYLDGFRVAWLDPKSGRVVFDGSLSEACAIHDGQKVMNAAIDHWRATGRLFPEPSPEPVDCVCGILAKAGITPEGREFVICKSPTCYMRANTVEQWDIMQAALKAAKEGKS